MEGRCRRAPARLLLLRLARVLLNAAPSLVGARGVGEIADRCRPASNSCPCRYRSCSSFAVAPPSRPLPCSCKPRHRRRSIGWRSRRKPISIDRSLEPQQVRCRAPRRCGRVSSLGRLDHDGISVLSCCAASCRRASWGRSRTAPDRRLRAMALRRIAQPIAISRASSAVST